MKYFPICLFIPLCFCQLQAQVHAGVGFSNVQLSEKALDDAAGFSLMIEKDHTLSRSSRWKMHPGLHVSFLFSDADRAFEPLFLNVLSISPKVSYEVLSGKRITIAPYANPFFGFLLGLQSGDPAFEAAPIGTFKGGMESGIRIDVALRWTTIRLIPVAVQLGRSHFRHRMMSLLLRL